MIAYRYLDIFFFVFHTAIIAFVAGGWVSRRTRKAHFATVLAVGFSWFGLGLFYGVGFCPCTDWHWKVREGLGYTDLPDSYVKFLLDALTGMDWNATLVDGATFCIFILAGVLSVLLNWRDKRGRVR